MPDFEKFQKMNYNRKTGVVFSIFLIIGLLTLLIHGAPGSILEQAEYEKEFEQGNLLDIEEEDIEASESNKTPVVLISVDALRADHIECINEHIPADDIDVSTPNICELADDSHLFTRAYSQSSATLPSYSSMFSSRYPREVGAPFNGHIVEDGHEVLPEIFKQNGYNTTAFTSLGVLGEEFGIDRGFNNYNNVLNEDKWFGTASEVNRELKPYIRDNFTENSFLWIKYMDPHEPYLNDEYRDRVNEKTTDELRASTDSISDVRNAYISEVEHVDENIGETIEILKNQDLYEDSLIIFTADHGEDLIDSTESTGHVHDLHNTQTHVPLAIKFPDQEEAEIVDRPVGLIDITPTILEYKDFETIGDFRGESLFSYEKNWIYSEVYPQEGSQPYAESITNKWSITNSRFRMIQEEELDSNGINSRSFKTWKDFYERDELDIVPSKVNSTIKDRRGEIEEEKVETDLTERLEDLGYID